MINPIHLSDLMKLAQLAEAKPSTYCITEGTEPLITYRAFHLVPSILRHIAVLTMHKGSCGICHAHPRRNARSIYPPAPVIAKELPGKIYDHRLVIRYEGIKCLVAGIRFGGSMPLSLQLGDTIPENVNVEDVLLLDARNIALDYEEGEELED